MIDPGSKYADINIKFVDSLLNLTVKNACIPKEMTLKKGVMYHPGKVQNSFCDKYSWFHFLNIHVRW